MSGVIDIPSGWVETTLGEVSLKMYSGGTPSTKKPEFYDGNIPWIRTQEVTFNFIKETEIKITEEGLNKSSAKWIPKDTVIVAMYGNSAGRVALSKIQATTNQACCNFIANPKTSDSYFIFYNLLSRYKEIEGKANGAAQQNLSVGVLKDLNVNLPPLPEQKAIANILTAFDDKIENLQAQNKTLEQTAQTIFKEWFGKYQVGDELPEGWRFGEFGEIVKPKKGRNITKKQVVEGEYPVVAGGLKPSVYHNKSNTLEPVITISASGANAGFVQLWSNPVWSSDSSYIDNSITDYVYFCYVFLKVNQSLVYDKQEGSAIPHVYPKHLESLMLNIPSEKSIKEFESLAQPIYNKIKNNKKEIKTLKKTRDTLLPKLMGGQLRVNDIKEKS